MSGVRVPDSPPFLFCYIIKLILYYNVVKTFTNFFFSLSNLAFSQNVNVDTLNPILPIPKPPEPPKQKLMFQIIPNKPNIKNSATSSPMQHNNTFNGTGNSYKDYVYLITGQRLERFGSNFFSKVSQPNIINSKPLPDNYILDSGDELIIQIDHLEVSGTNTYLIDSNGIIFLPIVGPLKVSGYQLSKAVSLIKSTYQENPQKCICKYSQWQS